MLSESEQCVKFSFFSLSAMAMQVHILAGQLVCLVPPQHPTTASASREVHLQTVKLTGPLLHFFHRHMGLLHKGIFRLNGSESEMEMVIKRIKP